MMRFPYWQAMCGGNREDEEGPSRVRSDVFPRFKRQLCVLQHRMRFDAQIDSNLISVIQLKLCMFCVYFVL